MILGRKFKLYILNLLLFCGLATGSATRADKHRAILDNIIVPSDSKATLRCSYPSCLVVYLGEGAASNHHSKRSTGDVELMLTGTTLEVSSSGGPLLLLKIGLKDIRLTGEDCGCDSFDGGLICNCGGNGHPLVWSKVVGKLTVSANLLRAGQQLEDASDRNQTLLIAVTDICLTDMTGAGKKDSLRFSRPSSVHLTRGHAYWIGPGLHRIQNIAQSAARFVTIEF